MNMFAPARVEVCVQFEFTTYKLTDIVVKKKNLV